MNNDIQLESIIEDYLNGRLNPAELAAFEQLRSNDPVVDHKVVAHNFFLESMQKYAETSILKAQMDNAHIEIDVYEISAKVKPHSSKVVRIWRNNKSAIAIAASFLIMASAVLLSSYSLNKQEGNLQLLDRKVSQLNQSQNNIIRVITNDAQKANRAPAKFGGTGFAISSNGFILTNYHVIKGADSLYIQNNKGVSYKVKKFYMDPVNDIAILKVTDLSFVSLGAVPYSIKKTNAGIGEAVYTLGYPKDDVVLGDGYVSSKTGINGDTLAYQIAIPVNPGNSGGPLLDNNGNIVGVINGKEDKTDGAAFAVKSRYIIEALNAIPQDSLSKRVGYGKKSILQGLKRNQQVEKIQDYVFMIKVYN
ncbi:MAG: trypsin-like peptidase domain-containing protein [Pedobacter sp.]|nr:trypsin-like peptidase domain-containing protein [Pedobacter sp.]